MFSEESAPFSGTSIWIGSRLRKSYSWTSGQTKAPPPCRQRTTRPATATPYLESGILKDDPFISIDREGIGQLIRIGVERGRSTRPDIKLGICGEHGGDPKSVMFCDEVGLDYVSCSPFRVPVARLAAAQAAIQARMQKATAARPVRKRANAAAKRVTSTRGTRRARR